MRIVFFLSLSSPGMTDAWAVPDRCAAIDGPWAAGDAIRLAQREECTLKSSFAWIGTIAAMLFGIVLTGTVAVGSPAVRAQEATPGAQAGACGGGEAAASPAASENCVSIVSHDIYFAPNKVTIPADTDVTIELPNEGVTMHNFSITDHKNPDVKNLEISIDINPGDTKTVTVNAPAGTYYFYCNVPGHEAAGMYGYLIVEEGGQISAESATVTPPAG
jgi:nitrite reductase (NO-forming)